MQCNCNCRNSLPVSEQNCTDADKVLAMANKCLCCSDTAKMSFSAHVTGTPGPVWHYGHVQGLSTHLTSEVLEITLKDYSASIAIAYCKPPTVRHHLLFI